MIKTANEPFAEVIRLKRFLYAVTVRDGKANIETWRVWGYRRALRRGKHELGKYLKRKTLLVVKKVKID